MSRLAKCPECHSLADIHHEGRYATCRLATCSKTFVLTVGAAPPPSASPGSSLVTGLGVVDGLPTVHLDHAAVARLDPYAERQCRLANEQEMVRADAEIGRLRAEVARLTADLAEERRLHALTAESRQRQRDDAAAAEAALAALRGRVEAMATEWERGDSMIVRARHAKPSDYAVALRALLPAPDAAREGGRCPPCECRAERGHTLGCVHRDRTMIDFTCSLCKRVHPRAPPAAPSRTRGGETP